jgi:hypothetical protein
MAYKPLRWDDEDNALRYRPRASRDRPALPTAELIVGWRDRDSVQFSLTPIPEWAPTTGRIPLDLLAGTRSVGIQAIALGKAWKRRNR